MGKCTNPRSIDTKRKEKRYILVRCGKCEECLKHYVSSWTTRLEIHGRMYNYCDFVTLTYSDDFLPENGVCLRDIQCFFKRVRKFYSKIGSDLDLSYILISEYGPETHRPHYHALVYSNIKVDYDFFWQMGFVTQEPIFPERIAYVLSYHVLKDLNVPAGKNPNFRCMSKGLGLEGFDKYELVNAKNNEWTWLLNNSLQVSPLHRYFRKKYSIDLSDKEFETQLTPLKSKQEVEDFNAASQLRANIYKEKKFRKKTNNL